MDFYSVPSAQGSHLSSSSQRFCSYSSPSDLVSSGMHLEKLSTVRSHSIPEMAVTTHRSGYSF